MARKFLVILILCAWSVAAPAAGGNPVVHNQAMAAFATQNPLVPQPTNPSVDEIDEAIFFDNFEYGGAGWQMLDLTAQATWHKDDFNAQGGTGMSWWAGDAILQGYDDLWLQYLESPTLNMGAATNPVLEFDALWAVEGLSGGYPSGYDGWDGVNVWVSTDNGTSWEVLPVQTPAYDCNSLASFGVVWGLGEGVAGWAGYSGGLAPGAWEHVTASMTGYTASQVKLRFALASDEQLSTRNQADLTGFFVDNIYLHEGTTVYLQNNGEGLAIPREMIAVSGMGSVGNFWHLETVTTPEPPSPTHVMRLSNATGSYDPGLRNAVVSPGIDLTQLSADSVRIYADFWLYGSMNVGDPDAMPNLDYWLVQITPDSGANWYDYNDPWGQAGSSSPWIELPSSYTPFSSENGGPIDLSPYAGYEVWIRILFLSDGDGYNGIGFFMDDFAVLTQVIPSHDVAASNLWIPMPTSAYFDNLYNSVEVHNEGQQEETAIPIYWRLNAGAPMAITPFPTLAGGEMITKEFIWEDPQPGSYVVDAYTSVPGDTNLTNDTSKAGIVDITAANILEFGYDNRQYTYQPTYTYFVFGEGSGAAVRFTPVADGVADSLNALTLKALFQTMGPLRIHVYGAGSATLPGPEVAQFDADVTQTYPNWQTFDLSVVSYLQENRTDFWVWLEVMNSSNEPKVTGAYLLHGAGHFFRSNGATFIASDRDFFIRAVLEPATGVAWSSEPVLPLKFALGQNRPNPFNPSTVIPYTLPQAAQVNLTVYEVNGRAVNTLVNGWQVAGNHEVSFDAANLASGVYLYRLQAGAYQASGKMVLLK